MDLLDKTKQICQKYNIKPSRSKGQNFLVRENIYDKIVEIADLNSDDVVLEVGPGLGFLTERLARKAKKVIAVELDDKLAEVVGERMKEQGMENVEIINDDILKIISKVESRKSKVVANLPYNITSIFLRKILASKTYKLKPKSLTLMLQKEVAERIAARPSKMSKLAVSVQFYADAKIIDYVGKENFWPQPKVDSAIIKIVGTGHCSVQNEKEFFRLVKYGFSAKRKMLKNNLAAGYQIKPVEAAELLKIADFRQNIRAQELSVENWLKLFGKIEEIML